MKALYAGACTVVALAMAAGIPASASVVGAKASATLATTRQLALTRTPNLSGTHSFTIIMRSKAPSDVDTVAAYFKGFGMKTETLPYTKNLIVTGTYAQATTAGHMTLQTTNVNGETIVRGNHRATFPANIAKLVAATTIEPGAHYRPMSAVQAPKIVSFGPANGYSPTDIAGAYDINPVYASGNIGSGVNVAIAACSDVPVADVVQYGSDFNLPPLKFHKTLIDGQTVSLDGEAILDAERVYGTAPGANIYEYLVPDCTFNETVDMFVKIAEDSAKLHFSGVSFSYGLYELNFGVSGVGQLLLDQSAAIQEIANAGIPFFTSSGDGGSWNDLHLQNVPDVVYPASDTNAISIGGTTLELSAIQTRLTEIGWTNSGGGISSVFTIPAYQQSTPGLASGFFKNIPDLAMVSDPMTGIAIFAPDPFNVQGEFPIGGTSVAAPTFNGIWALINAARAANHKPNITNAGLALYTHAADFHNITQGGNGFYAAKPGYNNVGGLGAPDVAKLLNALK